MRDGMPEGSRPSALAVAEIELAAGDAPADAFDHQENGVFAFAPGGDRVVDWDGPAESEPPAAFAQPKFPRLIDWLDQHLERATFMVKTELARHGRRTGRNSAKLRPHMNVEAS